MSCGSDNSYEAFPPSQQDDEGMDVFANWLQSFPIQAQADLAILNACRTNNPLGSGLSSFNNSTGAGGYVNSTEYSCSRCGDVLDANGGPGLDGVTSRQEKNSECGKQQTSSHGVAQTVQGQQPGFKPTVNACFGNSLPESEKCKRLDEFHPSGFNPPCARSTSSPVSSEQSKPTCGQKGADSSKVSYQTAGQGLQGLQSAGAPTSLNVPSRPATPNNLNSQPAVSLVVNGKPVLQWGADFNKVNNQTAGQGLGSVSAPISFNPTMSSSMPSRPATPNNFNVPPTVSVFVNGTPVLQLGTDFNGVNYQNAGQAGCYSSQPNMNAPMKYTPPPVSNGYNPPHASTQSNSSGGCARMPSMQYPTIGIPSPNTTGINEFNAPNRASSPTNQNFGIGSPNYNSTAISNPAAQAYQRMPSSVCGNAGVQGMTHPMNTCNASRGFQQPSVITPCGDRHRATGINDITQPSSIHSSYYSNSNPMYGNGHAMGISQQTPPSFNSFSSNGSCSSNGASGPRNIGSQGMPNMSNAGRPQGGCDDRRIPSQNSVQSLKNKLSMITRDRCPCPPTDPNFLNCNERTLDALRRATDEFIPEHRSRIRASIGRNMQTGQGCGGRQQHTFPVPPQANLAPHHFPS